jgi:DNA end-binding protein Ku
VDISEFVRLQEIDPIYFETSYYAAPDNGGEKAYALLYRALAETGYAAIGSLAMHGREHATIIRPGKRGLIIQTLFYQNEVRAEEEYHTDAALVNPKELDLAKTLVRAMATPFDAAKLKDTFEERLKELIQARAEEAVSLYERGEGEGPKKAPVVDIMEALRKSLEMAKKPVGTEKGTKGQAGRRSAERPRRAKQ